MSKKIDPSDQLRRLEGMISQLIDLVGKQNIAINDLKASMNDRIDQLETSMNEGFNGIRREMAENFALLGEVLGDVHTILSKQTEHQAETQARMIKLESGK